MEFTVNGELLLWFASILTAIGVIYKAMKSIMEEAKKPNKETEEKLQSHDEKLAKDHEEINALKVEQTILLQSQLVMIQHMIDGNGIDGLKEQRDKIQDYLIKR